MPYTPFEDAVDFVWEALVSDTTTGVPIATLAAMGFVKVVKNEPGSPYHKWIGVYFVGGRETGGLYEANIRIEMHANETMIGATANPLVRFTQAVQGCVIALRQARENDNRIFDLGDIDFPVDVRESESKERHYIYVATITVPVIVGGGY